MASLTLLEGATTHFENHWYTWTASPAKAKNNLTRNFQIYVRNSWESRCRRQNIGFPTFIHFLSSSSSSRWGSSCWSWSDYVIIPWCHNEFIHIHKLSRHSNVTGKTMKRWRNYGLQTQETRIANWGGGGSGQGGSRIPFENFQLKSDYREFGRRESWTYCKWVGPTKIATWNHTFPVHFTFKTTKKSTSSKMQYSGYENLNVCWQNSYQNLFLQI